jgi:peptidoglycan/xylan/chitin deacetylase (PgdA/CDA1 family)
MRAIKLFISLSVAGVDALASAARRLTGRRPTNERVVLYYHAIPAVSRHQFAAQMDQLMRLTEPVDVDSDDRWCSARRQSAVTFDDAFVSVVDNALPELRARGIPCTIFVPTGALGHQPGWIGPSHPDSGEVVTSPELLRAIASDPLVGIGSHSVSHPNFRRLDDVQARDELGRSRAALEELLGRPVRSFSFPHGAYTPRSLEIARECGYTRVYTIEPERLSGALKGFTVGRVRVEPTDWPIEFRLKAIGAYRWMVHASALKRRLVGMVRGSQAQLDQAGQGL